MHACILPAAARDVHPSPLPSAPGSPRTSTCSAPWSAWARRRARARRAPPRPRAQRPATTPRAPQPRLRGLPQPPPRLPPAPPPSSWSSCLPSLPSPSWRCFTHTTAARCSARASCCTRSPRASQVGAGGARGTGLAAARRLLGRAGGPVGRAAAGGRHPCPLFTAGYVSGVLYLKMGGRQWDPTHPLGPPSPRAPPQTQATSPACCISRWAAASGSPTCC